MRLLIPLTATLLLAACASTPRPAPVALGRPVAVEPAERGGLIGLSANELATRFGQPRLQVREGDGTKLQFAGGSCVLDAYIYPPASGSGVARVTHVDTRGRDGRTVDQSGCIAAIEAR